VSDLNLNQLRINIIYTLYRKDNALKLHRKYISAGANVGLIEVQDSQYTQNHAGRLYYFDLAPKFLKKTVELLEDLNRIEPLSAKPLGKSKDDSSINFTIWLVNKKKTREPFDNLILNKDLVERVNKLNVPKPLEKPLELKPLSKELVKCSKCPALVREDRLAKHISKTHKTKTKDNRFNINIQSKIPVKNTSSFESKVILVSKRGIRIQQKMLCDSCHVNSSVIWHYADSNRGAVNICGRCKSVVFNRSFGKIDAMTNALQGGSFESNRRRH
jgi:hypothetical protein